MPAEYRTTLPTAWYRDDEQFHRELDAIWLREWLLVGHCSEWDPPGSFRVQPIGDQQIVITRDREGAWHAFHNTCRHRGSRLCTEASGRFPGGRIVCPYHAWAYGLDGSLLKAPRMDEVEGFDPAEHGLYRVAVAEVAGFVFINAGLPAGAHPGSSLDEGLEAVRPWPTKQLALVHRESHDIDCNWKVFWENFLECYHCPSVHPDLCKLVPLYGQAANSFDELPADHPWRETGDRHELADGAVTWSLDGQTPLPSFEGVKPHLAGAGVRFGDAVPSSYIAGHIDHFRTVQILPLTATTTRLTLTWFVHRDTLEAGDIDVERLTAFARKVVLEDARAASLNQQGLSCAVHEAGVLAPVEDDLAWFYGWLRSRLAAAENLG